MNNNNNSPYNNNDGKGCLIFSAIFLMTISILIPIGIIEMLNKFVKIEHSIWSYLKVNLCLFIIILLTLILSEVIYKLKNK